MTDPPTTDPAWSAGEWSDPVQPTGQAAPAGGDGWSDPAWTSGGSGQQPLGSRLGMLQLALAVAGAGLLIGVGLLLFAPRPTLMTAGIAVIGWLLSGIVSVLAVSTYQSRELRLAASAYYTPEPAAPLMRLLPLVVGAIGVVVNSYCFANWLARAWDL